MKSNIIALFGMTCWLVNPALAVPVIILKLDDLGVKKSKCEAAPTLDYLTSKQVKAGLGFIANKNDSTALATLTPYLRATNTKGDKLFEIWHHGLDHVRPEFQGTTYDYQKSHFEQADQLLKKLLGVQMHTFGTPYNASDALTNQVLAENTNYKVFLYSSLKPADHNGILYLDNRVNMENGTGNPEFAYFQGNYAAAKGKYADYMILQGHPNKWTPEKLEQFKLIIDFLIGQGREFVLPYEYYLKSEAAAKTRPTKG